MANFHTELFGTLEEQIKQFEKRIETDGLDFCTSLYEYAEIRLMAHKYAYYVANNPIVSDEVYDGEEGGWFIMGRALGDLDEDIVSPCIGWDSSHRSAKKGMELARQLMRK